MINKELSTYSVSWQVSVLLPAYMEVEAPADLSENDLIQFIQNNCLANFKIDTEELDYNDGFAEIENYFDFEENEEE